jgi:predicted nucleic acid-binding protein
MPYPLRPMTIPPSLPFLLAPNRSRFPSLCPANTATESRTRAAAPPTKTGLQACSKMASLDINEPTTHHYAEIVLELKRIGKSIPTNDLWIAALCRQHSLPLLSRDRHFDLVTGTKRIDW